LKIEDNEVILRNGESEIKTKTAVGIGRFLTQMIIRIKKAMKLVAHEVHGASFMTLRSNEGSNRLLTNIYTRKSDAFFRFAIVGRADYLPTLGNLHR
jgi:hypothetical protein